MRAAIVATKNDWDAEGPLHRLSALMLPLGDRPFLQHVVETLVSGGVTEIDFLLCDGAYQIEATFDDGVRWGAAFQYHLAQDPDRPYGRLRGLAAAPGQEPVLLGHGDRLPRLALQPPAAGPRVTLICRPPGPDAGDDDWERWTGWAWVEPELLKHVPEDLEEGDLPAYLAAASDGDVAVEYAAATLAARSSAELLEAQRQVLSGQWDSLILSGRQHQPGIWLCRNARVHPTAHVTPPVYVGENSQIGPGVRFGPNAAAGQDCMVDRHTRVQDALILPGSYVGCDLELENMVVEADRIVSSQIEATVAVTDDFVVGSMHGNDLPMRLVRLVVRAAAAVALIASFPVLLLTALALCCRRRRVFHGRQVVRLPAPPEPERWSVFTLWSFAPAGWRPRYGIAHLFLRLLPGLYNVCRGHLGMVGVAPREPREIVDLPVDWRRLYLSAKAGLVTEGDVIFDFAPTEDERHAAEAHYAVRGGLRQDLKLVGRYLTHLFRRSAHDDAIAARQPRAVSLPAEPSGNGACQPESPKPLSGTTV